MAAQKPTQGKKYYTPAEANAALPLVRAIVGDITRLYPELRERHDRLQRILPEDPDFIGAAHGEEVDQLQVALDRDHERMKSYIEELTKLGIEMKDPFVGLIDFRCRLHNREVYLCWRLGEPEVAHWHELDAGFAGRQKIPAAWAPGQTSEVGS